MRLFVAINLPDAFRRELWRAAAPLREAKLPVRWVDEPNLHLTLKFLGETAEDQVPALVAAIRDAVDRTRSFSLPVEGFGAFPSVERPRIFWVGCHGIPPLELIQHDLELGTERLGFPVEARPFRPHLTLGRVQRNAGGRSFRQLPALLRELDFRGESVVDSIDLMESTAGPNGSEYGVVHSIPLWTGDE